MGTKIIALLALFLGSCHIFDAVDETQNVAVYFNESNISVFEGGMGAFSLRIEPMDVLSYYAVDYAILNEEIAVIFRADRRGVVVSGRKEGSTVITASVGNAEAKAIINVIK
jgi:hypothetical protein